MIVAILDDHKLLTEALSNCIHANATQVEKTLVFNDPRRFLDAYTGGERIDLLFLDLLMPGVQGLDVIQACRQKAGGGNGISIIIMTSINNPQMVRHALSTGANGYLTKEADIDEFLLAMSEVADGRQYIGRAISKQLLRCFIAEEQINFYLTPREQEVLQQLCNAKTVKEIAYELKLSLHTVLSYQKNIMRKFKMNRTVDLVTFAMEHGIYSKNVH
ncbi:response regulator [Taibaiella chishuiensis]|uniref:DNA-binding NarL/FixJ family response regulator n=1 Tax=Taibaiella chishuiensis TaxID=1434707 RepID=A0A2P8D8L3_9BACT|nr:response regulator transcription factor [Taibaiella chishuiensis]PSK93553.1 DNA-binding NarL/FixJ family response regulator [Taibaiella chishuiensis]